MAEGILSHSSSMCAVSQRRESGVHCADALLEQRAAKRQNKQSGGNNMGA
jgi:hypothetical protein